MTSVIPSWSRNGIKPCRIYAYTTQLPIESLQDVRLVSQLWSHAAAAWLWHTFDSDLQTSATRKFDALLASRPGGFLDSVRSLNIRYCGFNEATDTRPLQLICMLTQGSLQAFAIDYFLDSNTLGVLIARQPNLRKLTSRIIGSRSPPGERLVAGNLKRLKELEIVASVSQAGYDTWFPHAQLLSSLTVRGTFEDRPTFLPWKSESKLKKLRKLNLDRVDFGESAGALSAWLELDCLEHLILRNCEYADSFLTTLTDTYRAHGRSALKSLEISGLDVDCEWIEDLGVFLTAISGLEYLYVSAPTDQRLEPQSICDQAASLRYLVVDYLSRWDQDNEDGSEECLYDDTSLRRLSTSCSHIEELGVGCAQIDFDDWGDLEPFKWNTAAMQSQEEKQLIKSLVRKEWPKLDAFELTIEGRHFYLS